MRKKEIGGYFGLDDCTGQDLYEGLHHLNLGRTALVLLLDALGCGRIYVPYFMCDSVVGALKKSGRVVRFYHITESFMPADDLRPDEDEYVLIVNFYGQLTDEEILNLKNKLGRIIVDNTHAYFQRPAGDIPTFYSCRKFFGLPDGAVLSYGGQLGPLKTDRSSGRMKHILGRYEDGASAHYGEMLEAAESFYDASPMEMSPLTKNLLRALDYGVIREKRNRNFAVLAERLAGLNKKTFRAPDGAFCFPFYTHDGISARKALAEKKIFVPTYWKNVIEDMPTDSIEYDFAANILALPCDQRYEAEDMEAVAEAVSDICGNI